MSHLLYFIVFGEEIYNLFLGSGTGNWNWGFYFTNFHVKTIFKELVILVNPVKASMELSKCVRAYVAACSVSTSRALTSTAVTL